MIERNWCMSLVASGRPYATLTLLACLVFGGVTAGQDPPTKISTPVPQLPVALGVRLKAQFPPTYEGNTGNPQQAGENPSDALGAAHPETAITPGRARLITLQEAQEKAAQGDNNPLVRLGQLQVEVAKHTRLGTKSSFFPQVGASFENFHFNKFMGQLLQVNRPIAGDDNCWTTSDREGSNSSCGYCDPTDHPPVPASPAL